MAWRFTVEPDHAPEIAFVKPPAPTRSGALQLNYSLKDDYGVVAGNAEVKPLAGAKSDAAAPPLIEAPTIPLSLPQLRTREGAAETIRDLTSHPWAGATVRMTLVARDEAGQEGRSAPVEVMLPARRFSDPLARAVVEQRAKLAMDANAADTVADALDALTLAPEDTFDNVGNYLALRSAYRQLLAARNDDDLRALVDYLWTIALGIEDGDLSLAAQALRDAQEALRQALENGASDEEIARLTEELRQAMQEFLQALAQEAQRNPMASLPPDANIQTVRPQDLERMLDQIENLAKNGARDAARQLLSELQNMMENLQAGRPMQGDQQAGSEMMQSLNELGDMIRRQQQLIDQTYKAQRGMQQDGQQMTPEELAEALKQLQEGQQGLAEALQELMDKMQGQGMQPNGKLGQAGDAMGRAASRSARAKPDRRSATRAPRSKRCGRARKASPSSSPIRARAMATPGGHQMPKPGPARPPAAPAARPRPRHHRQGPRRDRHPAGARNPRRDPETPRRSRPFADRARLSGAAARPVLIRGDGLAEYGAPAIGGRPGAFVRDHVLERWSFGLALQPPGLVVEALQRRQAARPCRASPLKPRTSSPGSSRHRPSVGTGKGWPSLPPWASEKRAGSLKR